MLIIKLKFFTWYLECDSKKALSIMFILFLETYGISTYVILKNIFIWKFLCTNNRAIALICLYILMYDLFVIKPILSIVFLDFIAALNSIDHCNHWKFLLKFILRKTEKKLKWLRFCHLTINLWYIYNCIYTSVDISILYTYVFYIFMFYILYVF